MDQVQSSKIWHGFGVYPLSDNIFQFTDFASYFDVVNHKTEHFADAINNSPD